jgi:hypothetical protein
VETLEELRALQRDLAEPRRHGCRRVTGTRLGKAGSSLPDLLRRVGPAASGASLAARDAKVEGDDHEGRRAPPVPVPITRQR